MNEGFEGRYFNILKEDTIKNINSILTRLNEAEMSDEDRKDTEILRNILSKAGEASYDRRRALKWTPQELDVAKKYNLELPQKVSNWDGTKSITPIKDKDVDYEKGHGRNREVRRLSNDMDHTKGLRYRKDANIADFIRKRKERGAIEDRPYKQAERYAHVDDTSAFGDTTFTHDRSGRFGQDSWDKENNRAPYLAGSKNRNSDLTDVEKDRVRVNKEMSRPVRDMKAALKDRKSVV